MKNQLAGEHFWPKYLKMEKRTINIMILVALIGAGVLVYLKYYYESPRNGALGTMGNVAVVFVKDSIADPLNAYRKDTGGYPTTAQGLKALMTAPPGANNWHGPYISGKETPKDPWGNAYQYASPGAHNPKGYDVWSFGPKGAEAKDAEWIGNW